ncbi:MAG: hypothetical protein ACFFCD_09760 [Promethearchaeota archaeon]
MSANITEILAFIEKFENDFDAFQQGFMKNVESLIQEISNSWKGMKVEKTEVAKLEEQIQQQTNELTELKIKSDELDKKIEDLRDKKETLNSKIMELKGDYERLNSELKKPKLELENLLSNMSTTNEKIDGKEKDKIDLEQKRIEDENKEKELKATYSDEKMAQLDAILDVTKKKYFFTSFLIENSPEELHEVEILANIMNQGGTVQLDDLKKVLEIPPIMATRTIKTLALKGIIDFNEDTNTISML